MTKSRLNIFYNKFTVIFILISFSLISTEKTHAASVYKVTCWLNAIDQGEYTGYNFVTEFTALVYSELQKGNIHLWDTHLKENKLDFLAINALEKSSATSFIHSENLYIYEFWKVKRFSTKIHTNGFVFTTRSKENTNISFGYLSYEDVKSSMNALMNTNVNGPMSITFNQALLLKKYTFDLIQVNSEIITSIDRSTYIKNSAFVGKYNPGIRIKPQKLLIYKLTYDHQPGESMAVKNILINNVSRFMREDSSLVFQYCETYRNNINLFSKFKVTELIIAEVIEHNKKYISSKPLSIIINADGVLFDPIDYNIFKRWPVLVNFRDASGVIKEKSFEYVIYRINSQEVNPDDTPYFDTAFRKLKWNELTAQVRDLKAKAGLEKK